MTPQFRDKPDITLETLVSDMIGHEGRISKTEVIIEKIDKLNDTLRADIKNLLHEFFNFKLEIKQELVRIERAYKSYFWMVITSLSTLIAFIQMIMIHYKT